MSISSLEQGLRNRLWVIDIPLHFRDDFVKSILKWVQDSGVDWTIKRLKSLKVDLYRRKSKLPPLSWVRKNRKGDLAGCLGGLFRWADKSEKNFRKVVQTLMCYTVFIHSKPTEGQLKKFKEALSSPPPPRWSRLDTFVKSVKGIFGGQTVDRTAEVSLLLFRGSPSKRKPSRGLRSVPQDSDIFGDAEVLLTSDWGIEVTSKYKELFDPVFSSLSLHPIQPFYRVDRVIDPFNVLGGKIAFIQEPGGKLRSVASPFVSYQLALQHFGKSVYRLASHLPWDCTHDQSKPIRTLQLHLERGKTVHSVDLSSATDYFPLEVQVEVSKALFGNISDIALFELLSKSTWISPIGAVRWNRGQPLGLFPSFGVFTVTHGMLLWFLNGCRWDKDFFVLGDDVVILNDDLHRLYLETLQEWGCPYSQDKSITSSYLCEFAGKVITRESVTSQYKWREMSNDNFVDIARQLGHRSRILLSKRQQEVFDCIKHCVTPIGLGFSYPGSSLAEMESLTRQTFGGSKERTLDSLVDLAGLIYKNLYGSSKLPSRQLLEETGLELGSVLQVIETFDKKVRLVLSKLLSWFHDENHDPRLYSGVPGGLGNTELPPAILQPSRITTLDRYRRSLGFKD